MKIQHALHRGRTLARSALLFAALLFGTFAAQAQTLTLGFANAEATSQGLTFDVVATASEAGTRLGDVQVYLDYNEAAFGTLLQGAGRLSATLGDGLTAAGVYSEPLLNDNDATRSSITVEFTGGTEQSVALSDAPVVLFRVAMTAVEGGETATVGFNKALMDGQQFTADQTTTFDDLLVDDLLQLALPSSSEPLLSAAAAGEGEVVLTWTGAAAQQAGTFELEHAEGSSTLFTPVGTVPGRLSERETEEYAYRLAGLELGTHRFRVRQVAADGTVSYSKEVEVRVELAERFRLEPAYPNPFNPATTIRFAVREAENVRAVLFNMLGQQVKVLYEGTPPASTYQTVRIDGSDLSSGTYMVHLRGESFATTQRILLLK